MNMLNSFKSYIKQNKLRNQYSKLEDAIRLRANLTSQYEFHKVMGQFYTARVMETDPNEDWWSFADAKEKQLEHSRDVHRILLKIQESEAVIAARKDAYHVAKKEFQILFAENCDEPTANS